MERIAIICFLILLYIGILILMLSKVIKIIAYVVMCQGDLAKEEIKNFSQVFP
jgi:hypothetical protein